MRLLIDENFNQRILRRLRLRIPVLDKGVVMKPAITSEIVVAYAQCPRKAYLLLFSPEQGEPHEYIRILEQQRRENQARYLHYLKHKHADVQPYTVENLRNGREVLSNACLQADGFAAVCDVLTRVEGQSTGGKHRYEPTMCVGTHSVSTEQKLAMAFAGYVLGRLQHQPPLAGRLITMDGTSHTVKLAKSATDLMPLLEPLQVWTTGASPDAPPVILNKHCPLCPFQHSCQAQAEQEDNLSLLNGVTARVQRQYEKKGIFRDCSKDTGFIQRVHDGVMRGFVDGLRLGLLATCRAQYAP